MTDDERNSRDGRRRDARLDFTRDRLSFFDASLDSAASDLPEGKTCSNVFLLVTNSFYAT